MAIKTIISVCRANVQRSPTCEAILHYEASQRGLSDMHFISRGTVVSAMLSGEPTMLSLQKVLNGALYYNVIPANKKEEVIHLLSQIHDLKCDDDTLARLRSYFAQYGMQTLGILAGYRNSALTLAGIPENMLPGMLRQYDPNEPGLVITMGPRLAESILELHTATKPQVICYGDLVGKSSLEDNLMGGLAEAKRQVEYFMDTRKKALDLILGLISF